MSDPMDIGLDWVDPTPYDPCVQARREERERIANLAADLVDEAGLDGESFRAALLKEARDE